MYRVVNKLGRGRQGAYRVLQLETNTFKAMKRYDINDDPRTRRELMNELRTNMTIGHGHENIVNCAFVRRSVRHRGRAWLREEWPCSA